MSDNWEHVVRARFPNAITVDKGVFVIAQRAVYFGWLGCYERMVAIRKNRNRLFTEIHFTGATLIVDHRRRAADRWRKNRERQVRIIIDAASCNNPISGS